ncbi:MAG: carboxypeptidase-like regulatory domain-containing protein [Bacteroidales bacterium]|nr:carboxypeptidase-like regulatory domain-containing protein [Bacteroidales bacterium]
MNTVAQVNKDRRIIQFSGVVITGDSLKPVPFVNIMIKGTSLGTVGNIYGFFSFAAYTGDTILFSSVGYKTSNYYIPDTLSSSRYTLFQMMENDTLLLTMSVIYPWADIEALEYAIVQHRVPENDYDRAMKNLNREEMKERGKFMPMDGAMNYRYQMHQRVNQNYWNGGYMPNQWLNPFAWAQFFKAWKEGKFKKQD